ncbi:hypothetical protein CKAH01_10802 [Colletotrichum kahawae]|uniref:Uncharacterized protein n=1 Tax=Colletotrichum kahawae TaxID=34407 RepID=A0AAE0CWS5_COLKA|nr:hypothetical protein CKAH01_10802 [Colletotrichum kahawae]
MAGMHHMARALVLAITWPGGWWSIEVETQSGAARGVKQENEEFSLSASSLPKRIIAIHLVPVIEISGSRPRVCVCPATASLGTPFDQQESDTALPLITVGAGSRHIFPVEEAICKIWWSTLGFDKWSQHSPAERSPNVCPRSLTIPPSPAASHWLQRAVSSALQAGSPPGPVSPHSLSEPQQRAGRAAQHLTSASQGPNQGSRSSFKPASRPLSPRRAASSLTVTGQLLSPCRPSPASTLVLHTTHKTTSHIPGERPRGIHDRATGQTVIPAAIAAPSSANRFAPSQAPPIGRVVFRRAPTTPTPPTPLCSDDLKERRIPSQYTAAANRPSDSSNTHHAQHSAAHHTSGITDHRLHSHTLSCIHHSPAKKNRQPQRRRHNPPNLPAFFCPATSRFVPKGPFEKLNPPRGIAVALSPAARSARTKAGNTTHHTRPRSESSRRLLTPVSQSHPFRPPFPCRFYGIPAAAPLESPLDESTPVRARRASPPPHVHLLAVSPDSHSHRRSRRAPRLDSRWTIRLAVTNASRLSSPHSILHALRLLCSCTLSKRPPLLPRDPITTRPGAPLPPPLSSSCLPTKHDALPDCRLPAAAPAALPPVSRRLPGE